ncbi:MAG: hypothetical protein WDA21_00530 [Bacilli bacterium]
MNSIKDYIINNTIILDVNQKEFIKLLPKLKRLSRKGIIIKIKNSKSKEISHILNAFNIKDIRKKYEYIYDTVCDCLDNLFMNNKYCDFCNDKCNANREGCTRHSNNGCCYIRGKLCKHLKNHSCTIKCISCKLFVCRYLKRNAIKIKVNDIKLLKYFFNRKQKEIIEYSFYTPKDKIIDRLIKKR